MSIKFLVLGGGGILGWGGESTDSIFMGAGIFLTQPPPPPQKKIKATLVGGSLGSIIFAFKISIPEGDLDFFFSLWALRAILPALFCLLLPC